MLPAANDNTRINVRVQVCPWFKTSMMIPGDVRGSEQTKNWRMHRMCMIMTQAPTPGTNSLVASRCRKAVGIAENALDFGIGLLFNKIGTLPQKFATGSCSI